MVIVRWCKSSVEQGLCVSVDEPTDQSKCKVALKPCFFFWRKKHGSRCFKVNGTKVKVYWNLISAKFVNSPEPQESYYVALVCDKEVILLLGDMKEEALKKTKSRTSAIKPVLISREEHVLGRRYFSTRTRMHEIESQPHAINIECHTTGPKDPEMRIEIDGQLVVEVQHLLWKFRGNQIISVSGVQVQIFWDVYDWLFNSGVGNAFFTFRPISSSFSSEKSKSIAEDAKLDSYTNSSRSSSEYCVLLHLSGGLLVL